MASGRLTHAELASLDALITVAQSKGRTFDDRLEDDECVAEAQMAMVETRMEGRGGIEFSEHNRQILGQIRELASQLQGAPTLGQLMEMRSQAVQEGSSEAGGHGSDATAD